MKHKSAGWLQFVVIMMISLGILCFAVLVWRSAQRSSLASFWSFVAAIVTIGFGFVRSLRAMRKRHSGQHTRSPEDLADRLEELVREQWSRAAADRRILQPAPIPMRWGRPSRPLSGPLSAAAAGRQFPPLPGLSLVGKRQLRGGNLQDLHALYGGLGSGRIVIAGPPGSGKSSAAILLLLAALKHREQVPADDRALVPVPVIFTMHGWDPATQRVEPWLADRLQEAYPLFAGKRGKSDALSLINAGRIAVILDGLDEIPESLRPLALRSLSQQARFRLVVLTRSAEMAIAAQQSVLYGALALELQPVRPIHAAEFLIRTQLDPPPRGWGELIDYIRGHENSPIAGTLSSPLNLTLLRDTYRSSDDVLELLNVIKNVHRTSREDIEDLLLERVLPAAYEAVPGEHPPKYNLRTARAALAYIAAEMNQSGTRDLAWWHVPKWAPRSSRAVTTGIVVAALIGTLTGFAIYVLTKYGAGVAVMPGPRQHSGIIGGARIIAGSLAGHGTGLIVGLLVGVGAGFAAGPGAELAVRVRHREEDAWPSQVVALRWRRLFSREALGTGLVAGLGVGLGIAAKLGAKLGLVTGLGFGLGAWSVTGLVDGLSLPAETESSPRDPLASWRSDKEFGYLVGSLVGLLTALLTGLVVGAVVALGAGIITGSGFGVGILDGLVDALIAGLGTGLGVGIGVALTYSETWRALLSSCQLAMHQNTPLHLMQFLEDAHHRSVLRTVGPVYQFRHARLQDHLAQQSSAAKTRTFAGESPLEETAGRQPQRDHARRLTWVWVTEGLIAISLALIVVVLPPTELLPNVSNVSLTVAADALKKRGFEDIPYLYGCYGSPNVGDVVRQVPAAGRRLALTAPVHLYLQADNCIIPVPNVLGMNQSASIAELERSGFAIHWLYGCYGSSAIGIVVRQSPIAGTRYARGLTVSIKLQANNC
jgi:hypothetical protein